MVKASGNGAGVDVTLEALKLEAPDLFEEFLNRKAKADMMREQIGPVSEAFKDAASTLRVYKQDIDNLLDAIAALKAAGGSLADVPEYVAYRKSKGQDPRGKGKPSNLEEVITFLSDPSED